MRGHPRARVHTRRWLPITVGAPHLAPPSPSTRRSATIHRRHAAAIHHRRAATIHRRHAAAARGPRVAFRSVVGRGLDGVALGKLVEA